MQNFIKYVMSALGGLLVYLKPSLPLFYVCLAVIAIDSISAYRLSKRVKKRTGKSTGKFRSKPASKIFDTIIKVFLIIILANMIEANVTVMFDKLYLANYAAAIFIFIQGWSILENESSLNDNRWAKILQKIMVDKTERHFDIDLSDLKNEEEEPLTPKGE